MAHARRSRPLRTSAPSAIPRVVLSTTPILLADADYYGTLAAARALGAVGVPVYIASDRVLAVSRWSRHVVKAPTAPPPSRSAAFIDWLLDFGRRHPGVVLYPTSDETAFLYSAYREPLEVVYRMYQPDIGSLLDALDKKRLYAAARSAGLSAPETSFPETEADVKRLARELPMPVLVKPRTQVLSTTHSKGLVVHDRTELAARYHEFVDKTRYGAELLARMPDAARPMIQAYVPDAAKGIYMLACFVDRSHSLFAVRASVKVFQRPRSLGVGLCFEHAPVVPELSDAALRLAKAIGYYGVFSLEFVRRGDEYLLIDFNPRLYNQLAFDVARGLPLPAIVHAAACGDDVRVAEWVRESARCGDDTSIVYCNHFGLHSMLFTQWLAGRMGLEEISHWRRWRRRHAAAIDPALAQDDVVPAVVDVAAQIYGYARHPRAFLRKTVFEQSVP